MILVQNHSESEVVKLEHLFIVCSHSIETRPIQIHNF